ncbi:type ISP restriction/modification enzyme [Rhodococcus pyridinivorans]|uniref:type ISP restriction/modification enzyme n=1 Tax=Rhodococcus pyridinivorans TaxID=103816 RepID=UPI00353091A2
MPEVAERYMLGSRSALAWSIDHRYQAKTDRTSRIVNDPNDSCDEHENPTYVVDLIRRVMTVAVETLKIVDSLAHVLVMIGPGGDRGSETSKSLSGGWWYRLGCPRQ